MGLSLQVFLWCLFKVRSYYLKVFCLTGLPLSLSWRQQAFLEELFLSVLSGISGILSPPAPSLGYMRQKENSRNSPLQLSLQTKRSHVSLPSLHHTVFFSVCFTYNVQGLELYLVGEIRRIESICSKPGLYSCLLSSICNWVVTISQLSFVSKANVHQPGTHLQRHTISRDKMFPGTWQPMSHMLFIC